MTIGLDKCTWCFIGHQEGEESSFIGQHVGEECLLVKNYNYITKETVFRIYIDNGGVGGKSAYKIERYHGIFALIENELVAALGLRKIEKVYKCKSGRYKIRFSRDLKPFAE